MSSEETRDTQDTNVTWLSCTRDDHPEGCRVYQNKAKNHYVPTGRGRGRPRTPGKAALRAKLARISDKEALRIANSIDMIIHRDGINELLDDVVGGGDE